MEQGESRRDERRPEWPLVAVVVITAVTSILLFVLYLRVTNTPRETVFQYEGLIVGIAEVTVVGFLTYIIIRIYRTQTSLLETQTDLLDASYEPIVSIDYEPRNQKPVPADETGTPGDYIWLQLDNQGNEIASDLRISFHYACLGTDPEGEYLSSHCTPLKYVDKRVLTSQANGAVITPDMDETEFWAKVQFQANDDPRGFRHFTNAFDTEQMPVVFWMVLHFENTAHQSYHVVVDPPMKWSQPVGSELFVDVFDGEHAIDVEELHEIIADPETYELEEFNSDRGL